MLGIVKMTISFYYYQGTYEIFLSCRYPTRHKRIIQGNHARQLFSLSKAAVIKNLVIGHFKYTYKDYIGVLEFFSGTYSKSVEIQTSVFQMVKAPSYSTFIYLANMLYEHFDVLEDIYKQVLSYLSLCKTKDNIIDP